MDVVKILEVKEWILHVYKHACIAIFIHFIVLLEYGGNQLQVPSVNIAPYSPKASVCEPLDRFNELFKPATRDSGTQTIDEYMIFSSQFCNSVPGAEFPTLRCRPTSRRESSIRREMVLRESSLGQLMELYMALPLPDSATPTPSASLEELTELRNYLNVPLPPSTKSTPLSSMEDLTRI